MRYELNDYEWRVIKPMLPTWFLVVVEAYVAPPMADHKPRLLYLHLQIIGIGAPSRQDRRKRHGVRLLHAERQPLSQQSARARGLHQGHLRRGVVGREDRPPLGLDRRASFQPFRRQRLAARHPGATRRRHDAGLRLAPAVTLLPVHHPLHVAEEWATLDLLSGGRVDFAAGRGYDRKEYEPFGAPFDQSAELFAEGLEIVWRAWTETGKWSHKGRFYDFKDVEVRPRPAQKPLRPYVACFSRPSMELAAKHDWNVIYAPFAAAMVYGSLADAVRVYRDTCESRLQAADAPRHVLLLRAHRLDARGGAVRQGSAGALFPGRADRGVSVGLGREGAADLQVLRRYREHPARHAAREAHRQVDPVRQPAAHRRYLEAGRAGRHRRGDPLFQLRPEAPCAGEGTDGALHARGGAAFCAALHGPWDRSTPTCPIC